MSERIEEQYNIEPDENGLYHNDPELYRGLASVLTDYRTAILPWTDGETTRLDLLFTWGAIQLGDLQRGIDTNTHLLVSPIGTCVTGGFDLTTGPKNPTTIADRLGIGRENPVVRPLTRLINGVIRELLPGYGKAGDE